MANPIEILKAKMINNLDNFQGNIEEVFKRIYVDLRSYDNFNAPYYHGIFETENNKLVFIFRGDNFKFNPYESYIYFIQNEETLELIKKAIIFYNENVSGNRGKNSAMVDNYNSRLSMSAEGCKVYYAPDNSEWIFPYYGGANGNYVYLPEKFYNDIYMKRWRERDQYEKVCRENGKKPVHYSIEFGDESKSFFQRILNFFGF